jgi:hypothetical protein
MPFFAAGALYAKTFDYPMDGYSPPFQYAVGTGVIFYTVADLYFLFLLLVRFLHCEPGLALGIVVFTALGTNLVFYTVWFGTFSHAFSFFAITAFLYCCYAAVFDSNGLYFFLAGFLFALILVIRPVNGLVVLMLPVFFKDGRTGMDFVKNTLITKKILWLIIGGIIPVFIQCWVWRLQTGNWLAWSYRQEGFDFMHPHIGQVLFGFRRGLFVYCPLLLLSIAGIFAGWKINRQVTAWSSIFLLVFTYTAASWWHWTYGDTFGLRPFNDVLPVFMILFAFSFMYFIRWRKTLLVVAAVLTVFNLVFAWQFATGISNVSTMTADKFFSIFLRTGPAYRNVYGGVNDLPPYAPNGFKTLHTFKNNFNDQPLGILHVSNEEFIGATEFVFPLSERHTRHLWIEIEYKRKLLWPEGMHTVNLVFHALDTAGNTRTYRAVKVKEYPAEAVGRWETICQRWWIPDGADAGNLLKIYLWNPGHEEFYLDDYTVRVSVPRW